MVLPRLRRLARRASRWGALVAVTLLTASLSTQAPRSGAGHFAEYRATTSVQDNAVLFSPQALPREQDVPNPGRGQYEWLGQQGIVPGITGSDIYWRDQLQWGTQIEPAKGHYDFSVIDDGLRQAQDRRSRFMFRIMAYCPGCGDNLTPAYIPRQPSGAPDWNSEVFLTAWGNLMAALGDRYGNDPRLGTIDIGGYGYWGEWLFYPESGTPITPANAQRMIDAVVDAFPNKHTAINFVQPYAEMAIASGPRVGYRFDCVGGIPVTLAQLPPETADVWRRNPVIGEWCPTPETTPSEGLRAVTDAHISQLSSGNFPHRWQDLDQSARNNLRDIYVRSGFRYAVDSLTVPFPLRAGEPLAIRTRWSNAGSAPTYDRWSVRLQLRDDAGRVRWQSELPVELPAITAESGVVTSTSTTRLPEGLRGTFGVGVTVVDPQGYLAPMRLAITGDDGSGYYPLGIVTVG